MQSKRLAQLTIHGGSISLTLQLHEVIEAKIGSFHFQTLDSRAGLEDSSEMALIHKGGVVMLVAALPVSVDPSDSVPYPSERNEETRAARARSDLSVSMRSAEPFPARAGLQGPWMQSEA